MSIEDKVEMFKETYSAVYLSDISTEKKENVYQTANPILKRLIDNLEVPKTYNVDYIEGPCKMTKLKWDSPRGRKSFYLFGEDHKKTSGSCKPYSSLLSIDFVEYMQRLSIETPSFIDIYVELSMLRMKKPTNLEEKEEKQHYDIIGKTTLTTLDDVFNLMIDNETIDFHIQFNIEKSNRETNLGNSSEILTGINANFYNCIQPSTRSITKNCELLRIHNIDVRTSYMTDEIYDDFYLEVLVCVMLYMKVDYNVKIKLLKRVGYPILKVLSKMVCGSNFDISYFVAIALSNPFVRKEIKQTYMRTEILSFIRNKYEETFSLFPDCYLIIKELIIMLLNDCPVKDIDLIKLGNFIRRIHALSMDIYCLCRVFKEYKVSDSFQPKESKNIIIYGGYFHTENYREFLKSVGAIETFHHETPNCKSCVRTKMRLPIIDVKLIRFNMFIDFLNKKLRDQISTFNIDFFNHLLSILEYGNQYADYFYYSVKNNQITEEKYIEEIDNLKTYVSDRFYNESQIPR